MMKRITCLTCVVLTLLTWIDFMRAAESQDPFMGEYTGTFIPKKGESYHAKCHVVARGSGLYHAVLTAPDKLSEKVEFDLVAMDEKVAHTEGTDGKKWNGMLIRGKLSVISEQGSFLMIPSDRHSPTEGQQPPPGAVVLLPYKAGEKTKADAWTNASWPLSEDGSMQVGKGPNLTRHPHKSGLFHIEFLCPFEPEKQGQGRGNSGVYFASRYEVQILDSFGLEPGMGDCGSIYGVAVTRENACLPPLRWQTYDVIYHAPREKKDGTFIPACMTVFHNGIMIHENQSVPGPTTAAPEKENAPQGPLYLQDHGNPVRYRNIWYLPLAESSGE